MIPRRTIEVFNVISILLFSILANFIFGLTLDFRWNIDWVAVAQFALLTISTFLFYFSVDRLRVISAQAERDFYEETDFDLKTKYLIDERYEDYYKEEKWRINSKFTFSIVFVVLYFLVRPISQYLAS